jgi:DNA-binding transcriptional LysR family regulator
VAELDGLPLVMFREGYDLREVTLAACREAGIEPRLVSQGGEMDGVLAFVAAGLGAAVVPAIAMPAESKLTAIPFRHPGLSRTVALAHRADRPVPRPAQALVAQLTALGNAGVPVAGPRRG